MQFGFSGAPRMSLRHYQFAHDSATAKPLGSIRGPAGKRANIGATCPKLLNGMEPVAL